MEMLWRSIGFAEFKREKGGKPMWEFGRAVPREP
jgi:hypothetical protein